MTIHCSVTKAPTNTAMRPTGGLIFADVVSIATAAFIGMVLTTVSHPGPGPILFAVLFFLIGLGIVRVCKSHKEEQRAFCLTFAICLAAVGVARVSAVSFADAFQNSSDPDHFYRLATNETGRLKIADMMLQTEGSGAILVWRGLYGVVSGTGLDPDPYVGIYLNTLLVALCGAVSVRIGFTLFGDDTRRLRLIANLFATSGLLWIFAALHLRDSFALLCGTLLLLVWVQVLAAPNFKRVIAVVATSALLAPAMWSIRQESVSLILLFPLFGLLSAFLSFGRSPFRLFVTAVILIGVVIAMARSQSVPDNLGRLANIREGYSSKSIATDSTSLGVRFLVTAPLPIRATCGAIYLYIFPIPFWNGFQLSSAYHLFKSCHAVLLLAIGPLFSLGMLKAIRMRSSAPMTFIAIIVLFAFSGVAVTSMETRHVGQFLPALFIIAALPNLTERRDKSNHRWLAVIWLTGLLVLYSAWALLKFGM